jgi:hypothetical protein
LFSLSIQAQFQLSGIVKDTSNNKPLPFASIYITTGMNTISDVDGKFNITTLAPISEFTISYIGYDKKTTPIEKGKSFYQISLQQNTNTLQEVIIPRENPAITIIRKVIAKKIYWLDPKDGLMEKKEKLVNDEWKVTYQHVTSNVHQVFKMFFKYFEETPLNDLASSLMASWSKCFRG